MGPTDSKAVDLAPHPVPMKPPKGASGRIVATCDLVFEGLQGAVVERVYPFQAIQRRAPVRRPENSHRMDERTDDRDAQRRQNSQMQPAGYQCLQIE